MRIYSMQTYLLYIGVEFYIIAATITLPTCAHFLHIEILGSVEPNYCD